MRTYRDKRGGLEIEKLAPDESQNKNSQRKPHKVTPENEIKHISADKMMDTIQSYQMAQFTNNPNVNGGSECVFCGTKTSFDNRHVCVECWKKYNDDIFSGIKAAVEDVDIDIE